MSLLRPRSRPASWAIVSVVGLLLSLGCGGDSDLPTAPGEQGVRLDRAAGPPVPAGPEFAAAIRAQERHTPALLRIEGVVGTGVGLEADGTPVVRIFVEGAGVSGLPSRLDDVPARVVVTGLFAVGNTTSRARPAPIGYSVGHFAITAGTIGGVVHDVGGGTYILSNNHVLANSNDASLGDPILQPGPFDGGTDPADRIGTLADFEPLDFDATAQSTRTVMDAAIADVSSADVDPSTPPEGYGTPHDQPYALDADQSGTVDAGVIGLAVQKFGRTSHLTTGEITEINVTVGVCYKPIVIFGIVIGCETGGTAYLKDQIRTTFMVEGGDSGSLLVTDDPGAHPVGLLFAGSSTSSLANRIDLVLQRFGVSFGAGGSDGNARPVASFDHSCADLACSFDASGSSDDGTIVSYDWDFGDGSGGSGVSASHTYAAAGTYDVTLTVTDDGDLTDTETRTVGVGDLPPSASFTFSCTDLACDFDGGGSSDDGTIVSYDWDFGDGSGGSGVTASHTYAAGGTFDVTLTVTDDGSQTDAETQPVTVSEASSGSPTITASGRKVKGEHVIDLSWTPVNWQNVYVFRGVDGAVEVIAVLEGSATSYTDFTGNKGKETYTHFVCEGTGLFDTCSDWATTSY